MSTKAALTKSLYAFILSVFTLHPLWADDTEIFFSSVSNAKTQPNLLFVVDGSGSMGWYDCEDGSISKSGPCADDDTPNANSSRLERMVNAMNGVLDDTNNVNVGMMRFSHSNAGARITYPVKDIDLQFCNGKPCNETATFISESSVSSSSDDAYEDEDGVVVMDTQYIPTTLYDGDKQSKIVGIRFPELQIPQGATIDDARIEFTSLTTTEKPSTLSFRIEDTADSQPFEEVKGNISDRSWWSNQNEWITPEWEAANTITSNSLQPLLQRVVQKTNWCGGNAVSIAVTGTEADALAVAFDRQSNEGPVLKVTFRLNNVPPTGGCTIGKAVASVSTSIGDVMERFDPDKLGRVPAKSNNQRVDADFMSGFAFDNVQIPKDSVIKEARIKLEVNNVGWQNQLKQNIEITLENSGSPTIFSTRKFNLTEREKTTPVLWEDVPDTRQETVLSEDIGTLVQGLVAKTDWNSGNRINAFFNRHSSSEDGSRRAFVSYNSNTVAAAQLHVSYITKITQAAELVTGPVTDVRKKIKDQLRGMIASGGTPTVGAMYEAQRYFASSSVMYGKTRCSTATDYWCRERASGRYSRVSHPESYTNGVVERPDTCKNNDLNSTNCAYEKIGGAPKYISPIQHECQSNHVIILTDGQPTQDDDAAKLAGNLAVGTPGNCVATIQGGQCGAELAAYMLDADYDLTRPGVQNITTHTIGFNYKTPWLESLAKAGGGGYYTANSAADLTKAVTNILAKVQNVDTTFVAPGATIDNYSRLSHRKDVYLALFKPSLEPGWKGNLKKFELKSSEGEAPTLYDRNNKEAVDQLQGVFKEESQSFWSTEADGNNTLLGGAAHMQQPGSRNLGTYIWGTTDKSILHSENRISTVNENITRGRLGASSDAERLDMINWLQGIDITDENADSATDDYRYHIGDPLHSKPVLVNYGGTQDEPDSVVFFGTNEGALHGISTISGEEVFAYYPLHLMQNLSTFFTGDQLTNSDQRLYGVDGDLTLRLDDKNNNGIIESGDSAVIYAGLRRGGRFYFALDVTDKNNPVFKFNITGGSTALPEMGDTWSKLTLSKIKVGAEVKDVMIFAGGYDDSQDDKAVRQPDTMGRAIYIIDAEKPWLRYWVGSINPESATEEFTDMSYSIPADITVVHEGDDKLASQLYVGDMGGRLWRFDINNGNSGTDLVDGGIIADLATDDEPSETRRFYHPPDISLSRIDGKKYVNIAIGSGYQAHPLNTVVSDKFFVIRYPFAASGNYGMKKENVDTSYRPITLDDLFDTTDNLIGEGNDDEKDKAEDILKTKQGWYITMELPGEKILGPSSTLNGVIRFISYVPGFGSVGCGPDIGRSKLWAVNLRDGTPDTESIAKGIDNPVKKNRYEDIPGGGIAPPVQTLFVETSSTVTPTVLSGANVLWEGEESQLMRRWYWAEQPD